MAQAINGLWSYPVWQQEDTEARHSAFHCKQQQDGQERTVTIIEIQTRC